MKINAEKSKDTRFSRTNDKKAVIRMDNKKIENVTEFRYLGALISKVGRNLKEVKSRIGMAKKAFNNLSNVLKSRTLNIGLQKRENIKHRKLKYIAHKIWENDVFVLALQGRIQGKPIKERRRLELVTTNVPANFPCRNIQDTMRYARNRRI